MEQIEAAIQASRQWLTTLQGRREAWTAELEKITRPQVAPIKPTMKVRAAGLKWEEDVKAYWRATQVAVTA